MSSTNKTTNYELSQFIGTDKPTFLGDYNGDMSKIDTQMKTNATAIATASARVETANQNASSALTKANDVETAMGGVSTTATNALAKATNNETVLNNFIDYLNLVNFDVITASNINRTQGGTINSNSKVTVASNSSRNVAKIYGRITVNNVTANGQLQFQTNLRPTEAIDIDGVCLRTIETSDKAFTTNFVTIHIDTTGLVTVPFSTFYSGESCILLFTACMLFLKNFGDTPVNN